MYVVEYVVGLLIVLVTIVSVLFILVLPRQPQGLEKLTLIVNKSVASAHDRVLARSQRDQGRR